MTETQPYAKDGKVHIPAAWDSEFSVGYTPDEITVLIGKLSIARLQANIQLHQIAEACAQGHSWGDGYNSEVPDGEKVTIFGCTREGCTGWRHDVGWLPFEPKQHVVPFASKLMDCTGPGCEWCGNEEFADRVNNALKNAFDLSHLGEALGGPAVPSVPITVKKIMYPWTVDATREQVQAALDARKEGR